MVSHAGFDINGEWTKEMENKLTAIQVAIDEMADYLASKLQAIKSYLEDEDIESATEIVDQLLEELHASEAEESESA